MITNKDIRVEAGNLVLNGDKYPLDGQSPEAIMEIVEDNSDTTPTENSDAPITSGGVYTALGTKQDTLTFDTVPTDNSTNPATSGGIYTAIDAIKTKIGANSGTLTSRASLTEAGTITYTILSDSAIAVIHLEGYLTAASDVYDGSAKVNGINIAYLGCREGVACSPAKREQIEIPFRVYKDDVITLTLGLTGTAVGNVTLYTT